MGRRWTVVVVALSLAMAGCSDDLLDELGMPEEDRSQLEDLVEDVVEAAEQAQSEAADSANGDDPDAPREPDWSPDSMPPPPGEPSRSEDQSDESYCPAGHDCGWASYDGDDGAAAREHYEDVFDRPPDDVRRQPSRDDSGEPYDAVTSTWDDGDVTVTVYTDHNGTDVLVESERSP